MDLTFRVGTSSGAGCDGIPASRKLTLTCVPQLAVPEHREDHK